MAGPLPCLRRVEYHGRAYGKACCGRKGQACVPVGWDRNLNPLRGRHSNGDPFSTGIGELDRVLGGGAVEGSLVRGREVAPGIGKSTLRASDCACLCRERRVLYASGEESERQLKLRAQRLKVDSENLLILSEIPPGRYSGGCGGKQTRRFHRRFHTDLVQ